MKKWWRNSPRQRSAAAESQVVGDGSDPATTVGPLINAIQRDRVERIVNETVDAGAKVLTGGGRLERNGYFYQPTVVTDVEPGTPLHEEEIFGPVMPMIPFHSINDVIEMANTTEYGLAAFVHTNDLNTAIRLSEQLDYGMVAINEWAVAMPEAPFGGMKQSGLGRESGPEGVYEYLEAQDPVHRSREVSGRLERTVQSGCSKRPGQPSHRGAVHGAAFYSEIRRYAAERLRLSSNGSWAGRPATVEDALALADRMLERPSVVRRRSIRRDGGAGCRHRHSSRARHSDRRRLH